MKKLLFALLLIPINLHAGNIPDAITTGQVGFLKPSTTTADSNRNALDKINGNWDMVSATFTTVFSSFSNITRDIANLSLATANISAPIGNSTFSIELAVDGPVFLATATPIISSWISKSTFNMLGYQAYVSKASSMSITKFQLVYSSPSSCCQGDPPTNGQYGKIYTAFANEVVIGTQATASLYVSSAAPIWQDMEWGVRVTTITDFRGGVNSGLPAEGM